MTMQQLTLPGELVKKNNRLVRSKINISSVDGSRILAKLIACVRNDDTEFKDTYRITVKDLMSDQGGKSYTNIRAVCRELSKATAEIEEIVPDCSYPVLRLYTFFSSIIYHKGIIEARFNWEMKPLLLDLRRYFTQYNLIDYLNLPSIYSQRIFEILKSWSNVPEVIISIEKLHKLLNTPESMRSDFAQFRRWILEKSHKAIQEKTSLRYEWEPIKIGRSVEKIRFTFGKNKCALTASEKDKAKQEKQVRLRNARFIRAVQCFEAKGKECREQTEKRIVCKLCREMGICMGNLKETAK